MCCCVAPERSSMKTWWRMRSCHQMETCCGCILLWSRPTALSTLNSFLSTRKTVTLSSSRGLSAVSKSTYPSAKISGTPCTTALRTKCVSRCFLSLRNIHVNSSVSKDFRNEVYHSPKHHVLTRCFDSHSSNNKLLSYSFW